MSTLEYVQVEPRVDLDEIETAVEGWNEREGAWPAEWGYNRFGNLQITVIYNADARAYQVFDDLEAFVDWTYAYDDLDLTEGAIAA